MDIQKSHELILQFEKHLINEEKSVATIEKYLRDVLQFVRCLTGCSIDKAAVMAYKSKLTAEHAPAGVNAKLAAINSFYDISGKRNAVSEH